MVLLLVLSLIYCTFISKPIVISPPPPPPPRNLNVSSTHTQFHEHHACMHSYPGTVGGVLVVLFLLLVTTVVIITSVHLILRRKKGGGTCILYTLMLAVSIQWTGLLDWNTGLTFDPQNSIQKASFSPL